MRKEDFLTELEAIAPKELALPFDNVGLLVGTTRGEINRVLVRTPWRVRRSSSAPTWF